MSDGTVEVDDPGGEIRERMHDAMGLPPEIAMGFEALQDGDDIPRHEHSRMTRMVFGKPYFWVIRNGKHCLLRGHSPYEAMTNQPEVNASVPGWQVLQQPDRVVEGERTIPGMKEIRKVDDA